MSMAPPPLPQTLTRAVWKIPSQSKNPLDFLRAPCAPEKEEPCIASSCPNAVALVWSRNLRIGLLVRSKMGFQLDLRAQDRHLSESLLLTKDFSGVVRRLRRCALP